MNVAASVDTTNRLAHLPVALFSTAAGLGAPAPRWRRPTGVLPVVLVAALTVRAALRRQICVPE